MDITWISLLPPIVVIVSIFITHRLNVSLILGILSAALLVTHGSLFMTVIILKKRIIEHICDANNIYLYIALISISSLIVLLTETGSAAACARVVGKKMHTKRGVETSSMLLSFLLSIDDYLSILTNGFVMRSLTDRFAVARIKLAYIVHSLAGPLVIIMPISTWAATILAQLDNAGVSTQATAKIMVDPFYLYLKTIPFMFYSLITISVVIFVVRNRIAYGPIYKEERNCVPIEDLHEGEGAQSNQEDSLFDLLVPIALLVGGVFIGILYSGGFYLFGGTSSFFEAFKNNSQTFLILCMSGVVAFAMSFVLVRYRSKITVTKLPNIILNGITLMQTPIVMVILAAILGSFLRDDLHTGSYIAHMLLGRAPLCLIPAILFIASLLITLATGSAWGTFSLLIPITIEMLMALLKLNAPISLDSMAILIPTLAALLSGASCGDHISPFSETTMMTGASTGVDAVVHARTQLYYVLPVVFGTLIAFIVAGYTCATSPLWLSLVMSYGLGCSVSISLMMVANQFGQ